MVEKGQRINERYEIIRSIGEGGMANVYLAYDIILESDLKFYKFLSKTLVNKTLGICQSIDYNKTPSIEKLKSYLQLIAKENIIDKNLSEIAQSIGISYRQLMRHMSTLCKNGYIIKGKKKGTYIIKNQI